jgi:LCP family protein required for cell wall assembly
MKRNKKTSAFTWQHITLLILCVVLGIILTALISATAYINHLLSFVTTDPDGTSSIHGTLPPDVMATATDETLDPDVDYTGPSIDPTDVTLSTLPHFTPADDLIVDGVINIMLVGEDRRPGEDRQRSDSMILCSFDTNTNALNMISFLRDTYVVIPNHNGNKLNAPYQWGGVGLLDKTMALNFGIHVDANVVVNFEGFKKIIDMLGGVDISLTLEEADHLNKLHGWSLTAGMQHLNGKEALAYSRIRKIDWDIRRTQRQRNVLMALINNFKNQDIGTMTAIATNIVQSGFIETDMSSSELLGYITKLFPMLSSAKINNYHIPATNTFTDMSVGNLVDVKVCDLEANRAILRKIFGVD